MTKTAFVLSHGHSGSTILDMILGQSSEIFSTGELKYLPWQIFRNGSQCQLNQDVCTCGMNFNDCTFWNKVIKDIHTDESLEKILDYHINFMDKNQPNQNHYLQKLHKAFALRLILGSKLCLKLYRKLYSFDINRNLTIYESISKHSNKKIILDSSKDPIRYLMLSGDNSNTKLLILVRHLKGVYNSYRKLGMNNYNGLASNYLKYYNKKIFPIVNKMNSDQFIVIRYENLVSDLRNEIHRINKFLNVNIDINNTIRNENYHLVAGNPIRYKNEIIIKPDDSWQTDLNPNITNYLDRIEEKLNPIFRE